MKCKLGLNLNPDVKHEEAFKGEGGAYRGEGIAKTLGSIRTTLERDGYIEKYDNVPHVVFSYTELRLQQMMDGCNPFVSNMMELDEDFKEINCAGFGEVGPKDGEFWKEDCKKCPYLQE